MLAPDVGAIVEYGTTPYGNAPETYRVCAWMRLAGPLKVEDYPNLGQVIYDTSMSIEPAKAQDVKYEYCKREEATHLSLYGHQGAIAPIEACKVVGRVEWAQSEDTAYRDKAKMLADENDLLF